MVRLPGSSRSGGTGGAGCWWNSGFLLAFIFPEKSVMSYRYLSSSCSTSSCSCDRHPQAHHLQGTIQVTCICRSPEGLCTSTPC